MSVLVPGRLAFVWVALSKCHSTKRWEGQGQLPLSCRLLHSASEGHPGLWRAGQSLPQAPSEAQQEAPVSLSSNFPDSGAGVQCGLHLPSLSSTVSGPWGCGFRLCLPWYHRGVRNSE